MPLCLYSSCLYSSYVLYWGLRFYDTAIRRYKDAATRRYSITEVPRNLGINKSTWVTTILCCWVTRVGRWAPPHPTHFVFLHFLLAVFVSLDPLCCGLAQVGVWSWSWSWSLGGEEWGMGNGGIWYLIFDIWYVMRATYDYDDYDRAMTMAMTRTMT